MKSLQTRVPFKPAELGVIAIVLTAGMLFGAFGAFLVLTIAKGVGLE